MTSYELLARDLAEIQERLQAHGSLLERLHSGGEEPLHCPCVKPCPHQQKLQETLLHCIRVLEDSRRSFKSRQLETLRKELIGVLAETA